MFLRQPMRRLAPLAAVTATLLLPLALVLLPRPAAAAVAVADPAAGVAGKAATVSPFSTQRVVVPMFFPVIGKVSYTDTFLACRSGCTRRHLGQDLMGTKMEPLIAAFSGTVSYLQRETVVGQGNILSITRLDRLWSVNYLHVNNDTPGTDDGRGTARYAFLPGLRRGGKVVAGQLLGWLGDSGNAESVGPHLHFELRQGGDPWAGVAYNAKPSLDVARRLAAPVIAAPHQAGELVRSTPTGPVYLIGPDGRRRSVPPSTMTLYGWTARDVVTVSAGELAALYPYAGTVPLRDGSVVRAPDATLWATTLGRRVQVTTTDLATMGLTAAGAVPVTADALLGTPVASVGTPAPGVFREGAFVREATNSQVWLIRGGQRHPMCMGSWGWWRVSGGQVAVLPAGALAAPGAPPVGSVVAYPDGTIFQASQGWFLMVGGLRRQITDLRALGYYNWSSKQSYWLYAAVTALVPLGPAVA